MHAATDLPANRPVDWRRDDLLRDWQISRRRRMIADAVGSAFAFVMLVWLTRRRQ